MAKTKVSQFDAVASNNTDINSVNVAEGCPPSGINNAIREMASLLKKQEVGTDAMTSPDIDGGTIDGATIGASSPSTGAFTTLTASGNLSVDGGTIKLDGNYPTGSDNVALGNTALADGSLSGARNTAIGSASLTANTSGQNNISVGFNSMLANTTGSENISVGVGALDANIIGGNNTALGRSALTNNTASNNTAVGQNSLYTNTTGTLNTALGQQSLYSNSTASNCTAVGYQALYANTTPNLTAVGWKALNSNTTGSSGTAVGYNSLEENTTGSYNTAFGRQALQENTTASANTAMGYTALRDNLTGANNTALGYLALQQNTTGSSNTAIGKDALDSNTEGDGNVAVGVDTLQTNSSGDNNTATGNGALFRNTTGSTNTAIGYESLRENTTASNNTALGYRALYNNTTGTSNTALGTGSGDNITSGSGNLVSGYDAGRNITTGGNNTYIGSYSGRDNQTASYNTYVGYNCGHLISTGAKNTIIGNYSGNEGGLDIRTSSNNIVLSDGDGNPRGVFDNSGNFLVGKTSTGAGAGAELRADGQIVAYRSNNRVAYLNRVGSDGIITQFLKDNNIVGQIGSIVASGASRLYLGNSETNLVFNNGVPEIYPANSNGSKRDNAVDLGNATARFDDIRATNGTIQTSDRNEKQDIEELSEAEQRVAVVAKGLMRKFRWKDSVAKKGDNARTHFGIIAQDLQDAFTAEGLDAGDYAMFISDTWWEKEISVDAIEADEENGIEAQDAYTYMDTKDEATEGYTSKTRLGVRYNQLLAFIISAI
jgi:hypothetical protein